MKTWVLASVVISAVMLMGIFGGINLDTAIIAIAIILGADIIGNAIDNISKK